MKELEQTVRQNMATLEQNMSQNIVALIHLMENDLTQELKLGGHKMPYDFNLRKQIFLWRIMINSPKMMKRVRQNP